MQSTTGDMIRRRVRSIERRCLVPATPLLVRPNPHPLHDGRTKLMVISVVVILADSPVLEALRVGGTSKVAYTFGHLPESPTRPRAGAQRDSYPWGTRIGSVRRDFIVFVMSVSA